MQNATSCLAEPSILTVNHKPAVVKKTEGIVEFKVQNRSENFRYAVSSIDDKLRIWIEDVQSKQQWQTSEMEMKDFVNNGNAIANARMQDYIERFEACLAEAETTTKKRLRSLTTTDKLGCRILNLTVVLQSGTFSTSLKYSFPLASIPLEKVDLLGAQMRDCTDEIANIKQKIQRWNLR